MTGVERGQGAADRTSVAILRRRERAMELVAQGLSLSIVAERVGISRGRLGAWVHEANKKKEGV